MIKCQELYTRRQRDGIQSINRVYLSQITCKEKKLESLANAEVSVRQILAEERPTMHR